MILFFENNANQAIEYAEQGGQALHLMDAQNWPGAAPAVFRRHRNWAHLIDRDEARLVATAKRLGVKNIKVSRQNRPGQHIDLCGEPLARAIGEAMQQIQERMEYERNR